MKSVRHEGIYDLQRYFHECWVILCRYAMLGHEAGPMLLLAVARQALLQLDSFSPQELTNMVSCFIHSVLHIHVLVVSIML